MSRSLLASSSSRACTPTRYTVKYFYRCTPSFTFIYSESGAVQHTCDSTLDIEFPSLPYLVLNIQSNKEVTIQHYSQHLVYITRS
ncbi:unnamed protein product [Spodoptera littoralis]|uniref:Uncharacterized protein n=1 Tax=Spodoptera littoralis TaxID=7109 RepID=A0A9P0HYE1_SPOLI|nr:unnamed protein product [Spodoptera littoralis]CAH1636254.1 unnamed protein product [Spodoptera littoralis]